MNLKLKLNIAILTLALGFCWSGYGQLSTSTALSPTALVEDILVGDGVAVSGVFYTGDVDAIGSFNGASTNLGLNSGIILTTGTVKNETGIGGVQKGPFGPNDTGSAGKSNGEPGYGPLTALAGVDTHNAAILEFDFVPTSDTVRFRYVFGSDEYPEFVGEGFNDVFAFFISGPGFAGSYNMAQIPGVGGAVSIDNINNGSTNAGPCMNCDYYVNNGTGGTSPSADEAFYIQYDGFTTVMEAVAQVECGETYHLRIAIADAGDQAYDSGIFLEANSLESYAPIELDAELGLDGFGDGTTMAEGCETATITVSRTNATDVLTIPIVALGTAIEGVDYESLPDDVTFAPGQSVVSFNFDVYDDGIAEGLESLIIELNHPDPCGEDNFVSIELAIQDVDPLVASVEDGAVYCPEDETTLTVEVSGGIPDYSYNWDTGDTGPTITVAPSVTTVYSVTVNDICIGEPLTVSGTVSVPVYPPLIAFTSPDTSVLCPATPLVLAAEADGGEGTYTYEWYNDGILVSVGPFANIAPMVTTTYSLIITDGCGEELLRDITITVLGTVLELTMSPDQLICPGDTANIWVIASEGFGDYQYYWPHSGETLSSIYVSPLNTTSYSVLVEDSCRTYFIEGNTEVKVVQPTANFNVLSNDPTENLLVSFFNTSAGSVAWDWDLGNDDFSSLHSPSTVYSPSGNYNVTLIAYNEIGCSDTITKSVYIGPEFYFYAPNAFTPEDGRFNNTYGISVIGAIQFEFQIFNRWGELIYETTDQYFKWDGEFKGRFVPDDVVVYKAKVTDREFQVHDYEGMITILR